MFSLIMSSGDANKTIYQDEVWKIDEHCNRGYEPWWTLRKRKTFLGLKWWGGLHMFGELKPLEAFLRRYNKWPEYK